MAHDDSGSRAYLYIILGGFALALAIAAFFLYAGEGDITLSRGGDEIFGTASESSAVEAADGALAFRAAYEIDGGSGAFASASGRIRSGGEVSRRTMRFRKRSFGFTGLASTSGSTRLTLGGSGPRARPHRRVQGKSPTLAGPS